MSVDQATLVRGLGLTLEGTHLEGLGERYEGKVRDCYVTPDGRRILVTTDRISAFDRVLGTLPFKGQVLGHVTRFWFERTADVAPNHLLETPDPNVLIGRECAPLPIEFVVRAYLTGVTSTSIWTHYARGERVFCGHSLPDGLRKNDPLPMPIVTPSTKAPKGGHDVSLSREEAIASGAISARDFDEAAEIALNLFVFGQKLAADRGLILADTKYELGRDTQGTLRVIDEIHTPDSSRYWREASYRPRHQAGEEPESFDKEHVRRWLAARGFTGEGEVPVLPDDVRIEAARRYIEACETVTGLPFIPDLEAPLPRIARALGART